MRNVEQNIKSTMTNSLNKSSTSLSFNQVWNLHDKKSYRPIKYKRAVFIPMLAVLTLVIFCTVGYAAITRLTDNIDLPFVDDPEVIGNWEVKDFIDNIGDFDPNDKSSIKEPYLNNLVFIKAGKMLDRYESSNLYLSDSTWTKGTIINAHEGIASRYEIKEIDGSKYMFFEWKNEDYFLRFEKPKYYVLKQIDTEDYSNYEITGIEDNIDYEFENNPEMLGLWECIDYIKEIDDFDPEKLQYQNTPYLKELEILEHGKLITEYSNGAILTGETRWAGDLIINSEHKTASKCTIKVVDGETYMFFEWKSGDYYNRGMRPHYYVLKRMR